MNKINDWGKAIELFLDYARQEHIDRPEEANMYTMANKSEILFNGFIEELGQEFNSSQNKRNYLNKVKDKLLPICRKYKHWYKENEIEYKGCKIFFNRILDTETALENLSLKLKKQTTSPQKKELTFEDLFIDKENAERVRQIFEIREFTSNGVWVGLTSYKTELLAAYYALEELGILKSMDREPKVTAFYKEFGLILAEYMDPRNIHTEPTSRRITKFKEIFFDKLK